MKKSIILALAAAVLFISCAEKQIPAAPAVPAEDEWINDISLPVPVRFAAPGVSSKAIANGPIDALSNLDLGIIGVSPTVQAGVPGWTTGDASTVLIDNVKVTTDGDGNIVFNPIVYYPMSNEKRFAFYGYYPYSATATDSNSGYSVEFDLGNTDILYAKTIASDYNGREGYNAAYIREVKKIEDPEVQKTYLPHLQFSHLLTGLKFEAVADPEEGLASLDNVKVTGLKINTWSRAKLWLVDKVNVGDTDRAGKLVELEKGDIFLTDGAGNTTLEVTPTMTNNGGVVSGAPMGTMLLMPANTFTAHVGVSVDGDETQWLGPLTLQWNTGSFEKGKLYTMKIVVKSPIDVDISTGLDSWIPVPGEGGTEIG